MNKRLKRRVQAVGRTVCGIGFLFMLGSVGACEIGNIGLGQFAVQAGIGMAAFIGGGYVGGMFR